MKASAGIIAIVDSEVALAMICGHSSETDGVGSVFWKLSTLSRCVKKGDLVGVSYVSFKLREGIPLLSITKGNLPLMDGDWFELKYILCWSSSSCSVNSERILIRDESGLPVFTSLSS
ncbi:hypothetical protein WICPIJ_003653 [Wickerhamomyces pijperi]|uniref:Uncharacterized protein n=1 Tax=Wickerhamomyces pijperi TaxID=599730 RepID=A0A9P8TMT7_WICPI|nr:hypothetical protein WICPIJ_003653 [Wickerhamomyces pijperi]